ncbi:hypothetical protein ACOME3_006509 [Neoechinorhynchus agilis]
MFENQDNIIYHCTRMDKAKRTNAAFLIGSYAIYMLGVDPRCIYERLRGCAGGHSFLHFKDASNSTDSKRLSLLSVLKAVAKAKEVGLMPTLDEFSIQEYDHYFKVENGDISWIVPNKIIAFAGPYNKSFTSTAMYAHPPEKYVPIFKEWNVSAVVTDDRNYGFDSWSYDFDRLNSPKTYSKSVFTENGIKHYDMLFRDGSAPTNDIVCKFLKICHEEKGALAIHCKAGLGRTGTLICAYLIWKYKITAPQAIAWCRICRPGSVIGMQQNYLASIQNWLLKQSGDRPPSPQTIRTQSPSGSAGGGGGSKQRSRSATRVDTNKGQVNQAEMLNLAKLARYKLNIS